MSPQDVELRELVARQGETVFGLTGRVDLQAPSDSEFLLTCRGLSLTPELRSALPEPLQGWWDRLQPGGRISLLARLSGAGFQIRRGGDAAAEDMRQGASGTTGGRACGEVRTRPGTTRGPTASRSWHL